MHEWENATQRASEQSLPPPDELDVWREVTGGVKKGRIYGLGLEAAVVTKTYRGSGSSSSDWVRRSEFDELMNKLENTERLVRLMLERMQPQIPTTNQVEPTTNEVEVEKEGLESDEDEDVS